jgi:hypothetical protein
MRWFWCAGNIVQTFPAHEYDFWPKRLKVQNGEYIHFQWTGSNNNGDNNAGRGKAGTDRHNVLLLRGPTYQYLANAQALGDTRNSVPTIGALGSTYPTRIDAANNTFLGFGYQDLKSLAVFSNSTFCPLTLCFAFCPSLFVCVVRESNSCVVLVVLVVVQPNSVVIWTRVMTPALTSIWARAL